MSKQSYKHILVEKENDVLTVTLNRPECGNAVNGDLHIDLSNVFHDIRDDDAKVVVLTGAGESFCETGDMRWFPGIDRQTWLRTMREARWIIKDMMNIEQPVIVKLNGPTLGVGMSMALAGDLIYASDRATMGDPHVLFGIAAGDGAAALLPNLVSLVKAKEMLFLGREWSAQELADLNIVNAVFPAASLDDEVEAVAQELAAMPREALSWTKIVLNKWADTAVTNVLDLATGFQGWTWEQPEQAEAVKRFVASRPAPGTRRGEG